MHHRRTRQDSCEISIKVGFLKNLFVGAIGNEVAMKLREPELIYRLLRNKNSLKHKNQIATHSQTCQAPDSTMNRPLLLTGSLVLLLDFFELANSIPQLQVFLLNFGIAGNQTNPAIIFRHTIKNLLTWSDI
jgi:hypothetical protein